MHTVQAQPPSFFSALNANVEASSRTGRLAREGPPCYKRSSVIVVTSRPTPLGLAGFHVRRASPSPSLPGEVGLAAASVGPAAAPRSSSSGKASAISREVLCEKPGESSRSESMESSV